MLLADEWSGYGYEQKPLRVTNSIGSQHSTYRLQLPYRYGVPLLILSGTLYWLALQSLFLARVSSFDSTGKEDTMNSVSTIGYSDIAIITAIFLGGIAIVLGSLNESQNPNLGCLLQVVAVLRSVLLVTGRVVRRTLPGCRFCGVQ